MVLIGSGVMNDCYQVIADIVYNRAGLYFDDRNINDLKNTVDRRLKRLSVELSDYSTTLLYPDNSSELDALLNELAIGETYFFRNQAHFDALHNTVIPTLATQNLKRKQIRVWSAGCSTGEEPYSIAMLILEILPDFQSWQIEIVGSDLNRDSIKAARKGRYNDWSFRKLGSLYKDKYFSRVGRSWQLDKQVIDMVRFEHLNLKISALPDYTRGFNDFDLILCRNVMIYFDDKLISDLKYKFRDCLSNNGWLIAGHAETFYFQGIFKTENFPGAILYRKADIEQPETRSKPSHRRKRERPSTKKALTEIAPLKNRRSIILADSLTSEGDPKGAKYVLLRSENIEDERILWRLARVELHLRNTDIALEYCQRSIKLDDLNPLTYYVLAGINEELGNKNDVLDNLRKAIFIDRNFALAHFGLGNYFSWTGLEARSRKSYENALKAVSEIEDDSVLVSGNDLTAGRLRSIIDRILFDEEPVLHENA